MTVGRIIGFLIGTVLFGAGAKIGEICFFRAEKSIKEMLKSDEEHGKVSTKDDHAISQIV
jgi:hypothetical protein